jgi:hypothetical protein
VTAAIALERALREEGTGSGGDDLLTQFLDGDV